MAKVLPILLGVRFVNTAGNALNRGLSYVPGVGLARLLEENVAGNQARRDVMIGRNIMGATSTALLLLKFWPSEEEEEGEWKLEGDFKLLSPEEVANKRARGVQPYTLHYTDSEGRVRSWDYRQWGVSGMLATVAAAGYYRRQNPDSNALNLTLAALMSGAKSFTDKSQLSGLAALLGSSPYASSDPVATSVSKINRYAAGLTGGLVPALGKDFDYTFLDSSLGNTKHYWWQQWAAQVPILRQVNGQRVNIFGRPIELQRGPTSRVTQLGPEGEAYEILGRLNARGIWLPDPSAGSTRRRMPDGTTAEMTPAHEQRYVQEVGRAYEQLVIRVGRDWLRMMDEGTKPEELQTQIRETAEHIRASKVQTTWKPAGG
jgi:hypothetical protein